MLYNKKRLISYNRKDYAMEKFFSHWKCLRYDGIPVIELTGTIEEKPNAKEILLAISAELVQKATRDFEATIIVDKTDERNYPAANNNEKIVVVFRLGFPDENILTEYLKEIKQQ